MKLKIKFLPLLLLFSSSVFAQSQADTTVPKKKVCFKIEWTKDKAKHADPENDFRAAFSAVTNMAAARTPFLTLSELREGKADTAKVVQVINNGRVWTYKYEPGSMVEEDSGAVIRSGSRRYVINELRITPQMFGAAGDGNVDDTKAIQKAIDFVSYKSKDREAYFPGGMYKITNTIHLGYGVNVAGSPYVTLRISGTSGGRGTQGTKIIPTMRDRPAFAVTSGRQVRIGNITFVGDSYVQATAKLLFPTKVAAANEKSTWRNPKWPASATSETAPFAAIAIDPYAGPTPFTPYPDVSFPSFLPKSSQYNKPPTSDLMISDVVITGFEVGVVLSPSGSNQQTDFMRFDRMWIEYCTYGISVAHTDSREVSLKDSYISSCHTGITTGAHGMKLGNWGGAVINCAFDRVVQWFDFSDPAYPRTGPIKFISCYGENVWRLGNFGSLSAPTGSSRDTNIEFDHCTVKFQHAEALGIPDYILFASNRSYVTFSGGAFAFFQGTFSLRGAMNHFSFENGTVFENNSVRTQEYEMLADNATGGGIVMSNSSGQNLRIKPQSFFIKHTAYDGNSKVIRELSEPAESSAARIPPIYAKEVIGANGTSSGGMGLTRSTATPFAYTIRTKSGFNAIALTDRDLSLTFPANWSEINFMQRGGNPGDIIVDLESGAIFYVYSRTGQVVRAKLQNNYRISGSKYSYLTPIDVSLSATTSILVLNSRCYVPAVYTIGDLSAGSDVISNVGTDGGLATHLSAEFPVGAAIMTDPETDNIVKFSGSNNVIRAVDEQAKQIIITGNALKTEAKRRLAIMILQGPTNIDGR